MIRKYAEIFCWKNVSSFAKATHIFSAKNIRILYVESTKIVKEMTLNELVKLTTLWTTGPWIILFLSLTLHCKLILKASFNFAGGEILYLFFFFFFFNKTRLNISWELSAWDTIHMKCRLIINIRPITRWNVQRSGQAWLNKQAQVKTCVNPCLHAHASTHTLHWTTQKYQWYSCRLQINKITTNRIFKCYHLFSMLCHLPNPLTHYIVCHLG